MIIAILSIKNYIKCAGSFSGCSRKIDETIYNVSQLRLSNRNIVTNREILTRSFFLIQKKVKSDTGT